ncbi:MAG TPA: nucleotidyl transferase AbiEii/AbiGii toxin family protein [Vicinamibacteria bacterium]|nr:nucleotidyl transferase AbiEii/AbiGii toxin family protein [Vicinamibacteria bacterium]
MQAIQFWKTVTVDDANFLETFVSLLKEKNVAYCVVGGQAVNAYVEPLVSLDLDLVVSVDELPSLERALAERYRLERFPHSLNISVPDSDLRIQIQTDPRYFEFVERAEPRSVLGRTLPVASLPDVMQGKVWAALDPNPRASKRQKDLADISRILEAHPELRASVPAELLDRLV